MTTTNIIRDLGNGLVLRRSTPADAEKLGDFNAFIHTDTDKPDPRLAAWTRDLLERPHPTFGTGDFTLVEEQATGRIVSSMNHISQTWTYDGIPFKVGRPELVGTLPEFRNRGLVRVQFEEIHRWSAERGELVQGSLEGSNVNVVEELVGMIETQRAYEMASKAISTSEQMLQYLNNNL